MEQLQRGRIGQHALQVGRVVGGAVELHQVRLGAAIGELHQAERVAHQRKAQSFAVDRDGPIEERRRGRSPLCR